MKKLLISLTVLSLMVMVASPALAHRGGRRSSSDVTVENNNYATVVNNVGVGAETGDNSASKGGLIVTGDAMATAIVVNEVNYNKTKIYAPCDDCKGDVTVENTNHATVHNNVGVGAETGDNSVSGRRHGGGVILTGYADSMAQVVNVINSNVTRIRR